LKVLYDISLLGYAHGNNWPRTGLVRAMETTAYYLADSPECSLTLCAGDSFAALQGVQAYLKNHPRLGKVPLAYSHLDARFETTINKLNKRIKETGPHNYGLRAARKTLHCSRKWLRSGRGTLDAGSLRQGQIFHSPFLPIPKIVHQTGGLKVFLTVYDLIPQLFPELCHDGAPAMLGATLQSLKPDDWVLCISEATRNDLCNHLPQMDPKKVLVTYLGASDGFFPCKDPVMIAGVRNKYGIPDGPYILTLSSLEPRKRMDHLIQCFARMVQEQNISDLNLVLAGPMGWKYEKIFEMLSEHSDLKRRIILTGFVDDDDLPALYSGALAFAYPSLYEGFGLPVLEAMQCGVPVITSNTSSLPEVAGNAGIMVNPKDGDALCQAMLEVHRNPALRRQLSSNALERSRRFSWQKSVDETIAAYQAALKD